MCDIFLCLYQYIYWKARIGAFKGKIDTHTTTRFVSSRRGFRFSWPCGTMQIFSSAEQMQNYVYLVGDAKTREFVVVDAAWDVKVRNWTTPLHVLCLRSLNLWLKCLSPLHINEDLSSLLEMGWNPFRVSEPSQLQTTWSWYCRRSPSFCGFSLSFNKTVYNSKAVRLLEWQGMIWWIGL